MSKPDKFYFDLNNFDAPDVEEIEDIDVEPPPPTFSEEELDVAKAVSHAAGRNEGIAEEKARREQYIAEVLNNISKDFSTLFAAEIYRERQYEEESLKLGLEIISLIAPSLRNRLGKEALKDVLQGVLKQQGSQSEIRIEVHPETAAEIDTLIETIWPDKEDAPRYKVVADTSLEAGACALSWKNGGMVRDPQKTANDIKTAIEALLVEQVMSKNNSNLTAPENNVIKEMESSDSDQTDTEKDPNGEENNE